MDGNDEDRYGMLKAMLAQTCYTAVKSIRTIVLKHLGDVERYVTGSSKCDLKDSHEWFRRALVNAKTARLIAEQDNPELRIEAVTQLQQACEKATKAVLLANGTTYRDVESMGHNTIGAYVNLIVQMATANPLSKDYLPKLVTEDSMRTVTSLVEVALSGKRYRRMKRQVLGAWKDILPEASHSLGNTKLEDREWRRLTSSFSRDVVKMFIELHELHVATWSKYIDDVPSRNVELRPLLTQEISAEVWLKSPDFGGLPTPPKRKSSAPSLRPSFEDMAQEFASKYLIAVVSEIDSRNWPQTVDVKGLTSLIAKWIQALLWLLFSATVTSPHAVSSRYPADVGNRGVAKGSQDYTDDLGVVYYVAPLSKITEEVIHNIIEHHRHIETGFTSFGR